MASPLFDSYTPDKSPGVEPTMFTPELNSSYLKSLMNPIEDQEEADIGSARAKGAAGGLGAQLYSGSLEAGAEKNANQAREGALSGFNMDVAKELTSERNIEDQTKEKEAYETSERKDTEEWQKQMAMMGYSNERASERQGHIWDQQGLVTGGIASIGAGLLNGLSL